MGDMLVKLYDLPNVAEDIEALQKRGIEIRRALPPEKHFVIQWVKSQFNDLWASECEVAFSRQPVSCLIAIHEGAIIGFACHEATCRNFFGPIGVAESTRGQSVGKVLFLVSLHAMADLGYAYGIVGGAGPRDFFERTAQAMPIANSTPGIYKGMLRRSE